MTAARQLSRRLFVGVVIINLLVAGLIAVVIDRNRTRDSEQAAVALSNLSRILEQNIAGFLGRVDLALLSARDEVAEQFAKGGADPAGIVAILARNDARLPEVLGLRIIDVQGETRYVANEAPNAKVNVADRPHFRVLRDDPGAGLVISKPLLGRVSGKWAIILGRRIDNPDGTLAGQIHAAVAIEQFVKTFAALDIGSKGLVALRDQDAVLVARYPEPDGFGSTIGNTSVSDAFREWLRTGKSTGPYTALSGVDGIERLYLNRKVPGYPLYVTIGLATEDYLADWRQDSRNLALLAAIVMLTINLSSWLIHRFWRRQMALAGASARRDALYTAELLQSREEAESARQRSELILSSAGEGVCGVDLGGRITFINQAGRDILGLGGEEAVGASLHALAHHHHANGSEHRAEDCPLYQTLRDGVRRHVESDAYWRQDGSSVPVEFTTAPIYHNGVLAGAVNVFRDISRRLHAEEMVARNLAITATMESVLRQSLENAPLEAILDKALEELLALPWLRLEDRGCIFLVDHARGNLRIASQRNLPPAIARTCATVQLGQCLCGRVGATGTEIFTSCVDHRHETSYDGMPEHGHYCAPIKSGGEVLGVLNTYVAHGHRFDEDEERFLLMFASTLAGIVERKRIEEHLRDSEEISHALMNATIDAAFLMNCDGVILTANEALTVRFDLDPEDLLGKSFFDLLPPDIAATRRAQFDEVIRTGAPLHTHDERDGRVFDNRIYPICDGLGLVTQIAVFSRDVTERRQTQMEIEKALADLARSNDELQQFAYVASHDLREPLRMISSYLSLLKRRLGDSLADDCQEYIAFAVDGARRMDALIHDLLEYSRIGHADPVRAPVAMAEVVGIAIANLGATVGECHARIERPSHCPTVSGNSGELVRLYQNLIANALKYRAPDRAPVVTLSCGERQGEWVFAVKDNGIGIAPDHFSRIFMVFQRLHDRGAYEGTGIGLAICKKIVERHGGRIWVESVPGEGSTFSFSLPKES